MPEPRDGRKLRGGLTKLGHALMTAGVLGSLLPLVGMQLRRLQDLELGVWTGVPFIVLAIVVYAIAPLAATRPRIFRRAFKFGAIGFVVLIVGGFVLGMVLKNSGVGRPDIDGRLASAQQPPNDPYESRFPGDAPPRDWRPEPRERTPQPDAPAGLPDDHWTISVTHDLDLRAINRLARRFKDRASGIEGVGHVSVMKSMDGITVRVYPRVDAPIVDQILDGFGDFELDPTDHAGAFTLDTDTPTSAWRDPRDWNVRFSEPEISLRDRGRIRRAVRDALPDRGDEVEFLNIAGAWHLIASPVEDPPALRAALRPFGVVSLDRDARSADVRLRPTP